jgi:hypothetical protein
MAAPNLLATTTVTGKTAVAALTTGAVASILTNSSGSGTVAKINNVILTNYSGSAVTANVVYNRSSTIYYIGGTVTIPANSTLVLLGKDTSLYLEEGDILQANVSATTSVSMLTSYELMS